jgi:myo-inositol-1(or 4)-monophosphatase
LITEVDLACQDIIHTGILKKMSSLGFKKEDIGFIGEERLNVEGKYKFIIDPIDGTKNFVYGIPFVAISVAFCIDKEIHIGVIKDVFANKLVHSVKGDGAYLNTQTEKEKKLMPRYREMHDWIVGTASLSEKGDIQSEINILQALSFKVMTYRRIGSTVLNLSYLAQGIFDLVVTAKVHVWDIAAMKLILEESGYKLLDASGKPLSYLNLSSPALTYKVIALHEQAIPKLDGLLVK